MATPTRRALVVLARDLLIAVLVGVVAFASLRIFPARYPALSPYLLTLTAAAVVLVGYLVARAFGSAITAFLSGTAHLSQVTAVTLFLDILVAVGVVFALFEIYGVSVESIFVGSAFAGIVLGLASQTLLSNVFAGLTIVFASPYRVGDRIGLISASYGVISPSYPHELAYPTYNGVVEEIGLLYTVLRLDSGRTASLPNSLMVTALVVNLSRQLTRSVRVRMTLSQNVPVSEVEAILPAIARDLAPKNLTAPAPMLEVADVGVATWDAVVVVWTDEPSDGRAKDRVMRLLLERLGTLRSKG
jgi:small-conductance mechanosensitive channel